MSIRTHLTRIFAYPYSSLQDLCLSVFISPGSLSIRTHLFRFFAYPYPSHQDLCLSITIYPASLPIHTHFSRIFAYPYPSLSQFENISQQVKERLVVMAVPSCTNSTISDTDNDITRRTVTTVAPIISVEPPGGPNVKPQLCFREWQAKRQKRRQLL